MLRRWAFLDLCSFAVILNGMANSVVPHPDTPFPEGTNHVQCERIICCGCVLIAALDDTLEGVARLGSFRPLAKWIVPHNHTVIVTPVRCANHAHLTDDAEHHKQVRADAVWVNSVVVAAQGHLDIREGGYRIRVRGTSADVAELLRSAEIVPEHRSVAGELGTNRTVHLKTNNLSDEEYASLRTHLDSIGHEKAVIVRGA